MPEVAFGGHPFWNGVVRELRLAKGKGEVAAAGDFYGVLQGGWNVGKECLHLCAAVEILLVRKVARAALVAEDFALGNAHAGFVCFKSVGIEILNGVGSYYG